MSFSKIENTILHDFRNKINHAESTEDLKKFFAYSSKELLNSAFSGKLTFAFDDVVLLPDNSPHFQLNDRLMSSGNFKEVWESSDLPQVLERLAGTAAKHHIRLGKNPSKTEAKIRM
jgi:hypothetical protein